MTQIIALTGYKGSGKDTAAQHLVVNGWENLKWAGAIKDMLRAVLQYQGLNYAEIERYVEGDLKEVPTKYLSYTTLASRRCRLVMLAALLGYQGAQPRPFPLALYSPNPLLGGKSYAYADSTLQNVWLKIVFPEKPKLRDRVRNFLAGRGFQRLTTPRYFMQTIGTEWGRQKISESLWVNATMNRAAQFDKVVITDTRFPNEAEAARAAGGSVVQVSRQGHQVDLSHASERGIQEIFSSAVIQNSYGSLEDFENALSNVWGEVLYTLRESI